MVKFFIFIYLSIYLFFWLERKKSTLNSCVDKSVEERKNKILIRTMILSYKLCINILVEPVKVDIRRTQTVRKLCCCSDESGRNRNKFLFINVKRFKRSFSVEVLHLTSPLHTFSVSAWNCNTSYVSAVHITVPGSQ